MQAGSPNPEHSRSSLLHRLQRVVLLCIAASLLFYYVFNFLFTIYATNRDLAADLRGMGEMIGNRTVAPLSAGDREAARARLSSIQYLRGITTACLFDASGQLFSEYHHPQHPETNCNSIDASNFTGGSYRYSPGTLDVLVVIPADGKLAGALLLRMSLDAMRSHRASNIVISIAILLLTCLAGYLATKKILKSQLQPFHKLQAYTQQWIENPFSLSPVELNSDADDEISDLITAYHKMLTIIQEEHESLQKSEERFRSLAVHSPTGIYLKHGVDDYIYHNRKWAEITGMQLGLAGFSYMDIVHPSDRDEYEAQIRQAERDVEPASIEYRILKPGEPEPRMLMEYITPVKDWQDGKQSVSLMGSVLDISDLKEAERRLEHLAFHDPLTDLPNRRFFKDHLASRIAEAEKDKRRLSVILIDLDNFKHINDSLGHDAGDFLLQDIGKRFRQLIFREDICARLGGDEFIILLENTESTLAIDRIAHRILEAATQPVAFQRHRLEVSCSIGIARFPEDANNVTELIRSADIALYQAKAKGKNRLDYFSPDLNDEIQAKIQLANRFRTALQNQQLEVHVQPQFDTRKNRFIWGEVLARWPDAEEGYISPARFIPVAEESGLILDLGHWVLRETCQLLATQGEQLRAIGIEGLSVNLSAREFYDKNLVPYLTELLQEFKINPASLELELTESMVMANVDQAVATMQKMQNLGCHLSIDDFGTGYSSLSYLKQFNINYLKVDKTFVDGLPDDAHDAAITGAILAMASKLGLSVIAEGIETAKQRDFLVTNGCHLMQGYFFSRPLPISRLLELPFAQSSVT